MDIYQALTDDHQEAKDLFNKLEQPPHMNGDSRDTIFAKLKIVLEAHSEAEETVFYARLRQHSETHQLTEQAIKAHDHVQKTLEDLESMDKSSATWLNKLMHLHDDVYQHIKEEEEDIFQKAEDIFSQQQAVEMGQEFLKSKRQVAIQC